MPKPEIASRKGRLQTAGKARFAPHVFSGTEGLDFDRIDVRGQHLVTRIGKTDGSDRADEAQAYYCNFQSPFPAASARWPGNRPWVIPRKGYSKTRWQTGLVKSLGICELTCGPLFNRRTSAHSKKRNARVRKHQNPVRYGKNR